MSTVYTPWRKQNTVELANRRWRKQLLPEGTIKYKGRVIKFTRDYLSGLVKAFNDRAVDVVPFQLAGPDNKHTNAVAARKGTIKSLELAPDGLDLVLDTDEDGDELLRKYPDIGVSARIYENYTRESDGKRWPAALQHVLATLDPHITGMRQWEPIAELSNDSGVVIDLTAETFEGEDEEEEREEESVPQTRSSLRAILAKIREDGDDADLTDDELDQLLAITNEVAASDPEDNDSDGDDESTEDDELSDAELQELLEAAEADDFDPEDYFASDDDDAESETVAASQFRSALELANARADQQEIELAKVTSQLNAAAFENEKSELSRQYGIPPYIVELARPLLETGEFVVELANGDELDAAAVMRNVLHEIGGQLKVLDLGSLVGNGMPETDEQLEERERIESERDSFLQTVKSTYQF